MRINRTTAMHLFDIHTHIRNKKDNHTALINILPDASPPRDISFSVGLHPWFIEPDTSYELMKRLETVAEESNCLAIGECGLDRPNFIRTAEKWNPGISSRKEEAAALGFEIQKKIFLQHIAIANSLDKPLIIHCVRAFPELLAIHKESHPATPWIIHGFRGSAETADALIKKGIYLSFGKALLKTSPANRKTAALFAELPENTFFLETDNIDENSATDITEIYRAAAEIRKVSLKTIINSVETNIKVFISLY